MKQISVQHINKKYGDKEVLADLSFDVVAGEWTILMGPSGCGKTTMLRILAGLEEADSGKIDGLPDKVSFVFQENRLCEGTAVENVTLVMSGKKKENVARAEELLERLGLGECLAQSVKEYSGGMQRRVAIARALASDAPLLLMDEPLKGLDETTKQAVLEVMKEETAGKTVILVTHDKKEAEIGHCIFLAGSI